MHALRPEQIVEKKVESCYYDSGAGGKTNAGDGKTGRT